MFNLAGFQALILFRAQNCRPRSRSDNINALLNLFTKEHSPPLKIPLGWTEAVNQSLFSTALDLDCLVGPWQMPNSSVSKSAVVEIDITLKKAKARPFSAERSFTKIMSRKHSWKGCGKARILINGSTSQRQHNQRNVVGLVLQDSSTTILLLHERLRDYVIH